MPMAILLIPQLNHIPMYNEPTDKKTEITHNWRTIHCICLQYLFNNHNWPSFVTILKHCPLQWTYFVITNKPSIAENLWRSLVFRLAMMCYRYMSEEFCQYVIYGHDNVSIDFATTNITQMSFPIIANENGLRPVCYSARCVGFYSTRNFSNFHTACSAAGVWIPHSFPAEIRLR